MADKGYVFVSYSSTDRIFVNKIVEELKNMGIRCWQAPGGIPAGSSYAREIPKAIRECEVFLLFLSGKSQASIWVEKETDSAISNRKNIIPFQIDEVPLNDTFRFYLNNVQMISYVENPDMALCELKEELSRLSGIDVKKAAGASESSTAEEKTEASVEQRPAAETQLRKRMTQEESRAAFREKLNPTQPLRGLQYNRNSNALRMNRIPLVCENCGSKNLENVSMGTYLCKDCGTENYDDYQTVRNYLDKVGMAPAVVIEKDTGVPRRVIDYFFRQEYLEIPKNSAIRVPCERCGAPIRTGTLCEACKNQQQGAKKVNLNGAWHSRR